MQFYSKFSANSHIAFGIAVHNSISSKHDIYPLCLKVLLHHFLPRLISDEISSMPILVGLDTLRNQLSTHVSQSTSRMHAINTGPSSSEYFHPLYKFHSSFRYHRGLE
jgi:acyl carrier protein phosphodiesterase